MPVSIVPASILPLAERPARILVRVDRNLLYRIDPSMQPLTATDSFTSIIRKGRSALAQVHRDISQTLFGADFPRAIADMEWPKYGANGPIVNGYIGFYYDYNITTGDINPPVLELTTNEELLDNMVVFNAIELDGDRKELANIMINGVEAGLTSQTAGVQ